MTDAIEIFFSFWSGILNFLFNGMYIVPGVSIGYILTGLIIIIIIINVVISRPKKGDSNE